MSVSPDLPTLVTLIRAHLPDPSAAPAEITAETPVAGGLAMDSLSLLKLVVAIEDTFEICLEEGDGEALRTVGDLLALIQLRLDEAST
ncbi:MAG: phosphopantetheine-binding protein [Bradymonadia bacterium]